MLHDFGGDDTIERCVGERQGSSAQVMTDDGVDAFAWDRRDEAIECGHPCTRVGEATRELSRTTSDL